MFSTEAKILFQQGPEKNPCYWESQMTLQCLQKRYKEKGDCEIFGENVKNCKKFWTWVIKDRKKKGLTPVVPPIEDKEQVYKEYKHWLGR